MKVLFITPRCPIPVKSGQQNYSKNIIEIIGDNYEVDIIGLYSTEAELLNWEKFGCQRNNIKLLKVFPTQKPIKKYFNEMLEVISGRLRIMGRYKSGILIEYLSKVLSHNCYDIIHIDLFMMCYCISSIKYNDNKVVLSPHDAYSMAYYNRYKLEKNIVNKVKLYLTYRAFYNVEKKYYRFFDYVVPVSSLDSCWLKQKYNLNNLVTIGIPIEDEYFEGEVGCDNDEIFCLGYAGTNKFAEDMLRFIKNVWSRYAKINNSKTITVWGGENNENLKREVCKYSGVQYLGRARNYMETLRSASFIVYPQEVSSGIQTKLQQAMALGIPIISNKNNLTPLLVTNGKEGFFCETEKEYFDKLCVLAENYKIKIEMGINARELMQKNFSKTVIASKIRMIYDNLN